ncbi:MAG TPA: hypothetical protein PLA69_09380 [Flavobacterium sp.]|nr:hypothetical protein [Flavobacterium sp.]
MSKNLIIGIATGVAAALVIGVIAKKNGSLDKILKRVNKLADNLEDRLAYLDSLELDDVIPKGEAKNIRKTP